MERPCFLSYRKLQKNFCFIQGVSLDLIDIFITANEERTEYYVVE